MEEFRIFYSNEYDEVNEVKITQDKNVKLYRPDNELEVIELSNGRWTVLWAGLEYGPADSLESTVKGETLEKVKELIIEKKYEIVPSVAEALRKHYSS